MSRVERDPERGRAAAAKLKALGVRGVLIKAAEQGYITQLACKMPECFCPEELGGACYFEPVSREWSDWRSDWMPTLEHFPVAKKDGGKAAVDNAVLAHRLCNRLDHSLRVGRSHRRDLERIWKAREEGIRRSNVQIGNAEGGEIPTVEAEAAMPRPKTENAPEWKPLPDAENAQYLVDHETNSDRISTDEPRLKDSEISSEARLWDLLRGCLTARATAIAADLGVAESLAAGPRSVAELAERARVDAGALHRILRALASDRVFAETEPGVFANTPSSDLLRGGWGSFAHLFGGVFYRAAGALEASGESTFRRELGVDFWSWLAERPDERAAFDRAMEQGKERRAARLAAIEWRGDETVVDVGGGNGSFLRAVLQPGQRGIVLDLPETVRDDAELAAAGIEFVAGSFFEQTPPGDVYMLGTVLHDWDDQQATAILQTIGRHRGARILIIDAVIPPGNDPHGAKWLDLLMLSISGRERTEPQWHALIEDAGLELVSVHDGLIEARSR